MNTTGADVLPIRLYEVHDLLKERPGRPDEERVLETDLKSQICTLGSDRFVCVVRQRENEQNTIFVDLKNNGSVVTKKLPRKNSCALIHPSKFVVAVRLHDLATNNTTIQVMILDEQLTNSSNRRAGLVTIQGDVKFWTWIDESTLAYVVWESSRGTDGVQRTNVPTVYHWSGIEPDQKPVKIFSADSLSNSQVINYCVSYNQRWCALSGITKDGPNIVGHTALYSRDRSQQQPIQDAYVASFARIRPLSESEPRTVFAFATRSPRAGGKFRVIEIDPKDGAQAMKLQTDLYFHSENDFPIALHSSARYGVAFMITKAAFVHIFDLESGACLFTQRISGENVFAASANADSTGIATINRKGQVLTVTLNEDTLTQYIMQKKDVAFAENFALRENIPGIDVQAKFEREMQSGQYLEAAVTAALSFNGQLRNKTTIDRLKAAPAQARQISPILKYFGLLLDRGSLNQLETIELAGPILQQGKKPLLEKWLNEGKIECSEQLGNLVRSQNDPQLALEIYKKAGAHQKVVAALTELQRFDDIVPYSQQMGFSPDFRALLESIALVDAEKAVEFGLTIVKSDNNLLDLNTIVDILQARVPVPNLTAFLLDVLSPNLEEHAELQTRLIEINLEASPPVAEAILNNAMFSHFDKTRISILCEQKELYNWALELTEDQSAVKRILASADKINLDWLVNYFGHLTVELSLSGLEVMLSHGHVTQVVAIAQKYSDILGPHNLIELFEKHGQSTGLYHYLGSIVNLSDNKEVTYKYIEAATNLQQFHEVERVCRDSNSYEPEKVKNFLKQANLPDKMPLVVVCDRFNMVHDLILYLYRAEQFAAIEGYVQRFNPSRTPEVIGSLLDVDCEEPIIKNLLASVDHTRVPVDNLVHEVESRNRLKLLLPFLEKTLASGNQHQAVYNALAKIYIDSNSNPEKFLEENDQYDTLVVGKYCEQRDPNLAFIAYQKGQNDLELINVTNENSMFKAQARYLVDRADMDTWSYVLNPDNVYRRSLVDQVVATAVPDSKDPDKVSLAVKAFISNDMPSELIELLEKIILEPSPFSDNATLQNLLMLTAAKSDRARLMNYIHTLTAYTPEDIAQQCIELGMYDEAFEIYKKNEQHLPAVSVLVEHILSVDRAQEYAESVDIPQVWSRVAKAQLDGVRVSDSIESYIKANDPSNYQEIIEVAEQAGKDEELIEFLKMARRTVREAPIDSALAFCYARLDKLDDLENFLRGTNVAEVNLTGDKAFEEGYFEAAKILYSSISNWAKLATTLVHLEDHQAAVECARKANSVNVWKQVHEACISKREFKLAEICGLSLIVHAEELPGIIRQYERQGFFDELIALLSNGLGLERAHKGMFTELGIALSRYHPEDTMEHLRLFWARINIPKMIKACDEAHLWPELIFLHTHYEEWDNASLAMMEHSVDAWEHNTFKDIIVKVTNLEIYYRALNFYLEEQPSLIPDVLTALAPRIDVNRVVRMFEKSDNIPMIKSFLLSVQSQNKRSVNHAINELLIEEEDYKTLRHSVESFDNFDAPELAQRLEKHELIFFRQIAVAIWRKTKRWKRSIDLCKIDKLYKDAIETAAISGNGEIVEELLRYFVDIGSRECYVGMLYSCHDLIRPDVILEISWRNGLQDFTMPYMINALSEQFSTISMLKQEAEERKAKEEAAREAQKKAEEPKAVFGSRLLLTGGPVSQPSGAMSSMYTGQTNMM